MITAVFFVDNQMPCGFSLNGHAGLAKHGQDILCAAVSSAAYLTVNTITDVYHLPADIEQDEQIGRMTVRIAPQKAAPCRELLLGFFAHIEQLQQQYPRHIHTEYSEV